MGHADALSQIQNEQYVGTRLSQSDRNLESINLTQTVSPNAMFQRNLPVNNSLHDYCLAILQVTTIRRGVRMLQEQEEWMLQMMNFLSNQQFTDTTPRDL